MEKVRFDLPLNDTSSPQEIASLAIKILSSTDATRLHFRTSIDFFKAKIEQWNCASWRVGLIGITSSGKSTLVNGLLGEELLPTHVKPSSNCLIMTRYGEEKKIIKFYQDGLVQEVKTNLKQELDELGNELKNPTNTKKIHQLSVYSPYFKLNPSITICDTPGLDAYNLPHHDEITINNILPSLDLVLYISNVRLAAQENNKIVKLISETKKPLIWVLNCIDVIREKTEKDGTVSKSKEQVLSEHYEKVKDNLCNSGVTDPSAVPIVFVSSREALRTAGYAQSGFKNLINTLHEQISKLEPKFVVGRIRQISKELKHILVTESRQVSNKDSNYENDIKTLLDEKKDIQLTRDKTINAFESIMYNFLSKAKVIINSLDNLSNDSIERANKLRNQAQKCVSEANQRLKRKIIEMNDEFQTIRKQNNILNEDFFYKLFSGVSLIKFQSVEVEEHTRKTLSEKKSITGLHLRKRLGNIFRTNWGYKVYEETILEIKDIDNFKDQLKMGLNSEMKWLESSIDRSVSALDNYYKTVMNVLESRIHSIEEALRYEIPEETRKIVLNQLQSLNESIEKIVSVNYLTCNDTGKKNLRISSLTSRCESTVELDYLELSLMRFLNSATNIVYLMQLDSLCEYNSDNKSCIVICHWNQGLFSELWERFFPNDPVPQGHYAKIKNGSYKLTVIDDSLDDRKDYENILRNIAWQKSSLFLLISVSQIGFFQEQFFKSKAAKYFKKANQVISVIADFSDFFYNNKLVDYLLEFSNFLDKSGLRSEHIMLNHDDIGLGIVIETLIKGTYQLKNESDEILFINQMDKESYFLNDNVKNRIAQILPEWRNSINDK